MVAKRNGLLGFLAAVVLMVGCSDTPPVPGTHMLRVTRGSDQLVKKKVKPKARAQVFRAVPSMLAPTWSTNQPPAWRYQSGVGHLVTLEWNTPGPSVDPQGIPWVVAGYTIWRGDVSGSYQDKLDAGTNLQLVVTGLGSGSTNWFAATAYDTNTPPVASDFSNELSYVVPDAPVAMIQILYSFSLDGPWYPMGAPFPGIMPPPTYYKLGIASP